MALSRPRIRKCWRRQLVREYAIDIVVSVFSRIMRILTYQGPSSAVARRRGIKRTVEALKYRGALMASICSRDAAAHEVCIIYAGSAGGGVVAELGCYGIGNQRPLGVAHRA